MKKAKRKKRPRARTRRPRAIEVALAGLAHDIRTPLSGILALSQLLQASDLPQRERGWAEAIHGAADHLARLAGLVVDAAKAESAGLVLREELVLAARARAIGGRLAHRPRTRQSRSRSASRLPRACRSASSATKCGCAVRSKT